MPRPSVQRSFRHHYPSLAPVARDLPLGLLLVALDGPRRRPSVAWLEASAAGPRALVIGSHPDSELRLPARLVAPQHRLVALRRATSLCPGRLVHRIHGLHREGTWQPLEFVGASFTRVGAFDLLCLPTGDPWDWPTRAVDAWAIADPQRPQLSATTTPLAVARYPATPRIERVAGTLEIRSVSWRHCLPLTVAGLERGAALGTRRDVAFVGSGLAAVSDELEVGIFADADRLWAMDLGGRLGLYHGASRTRIAPLDGRASLARLAMLAWHPFTSPHRNAPSTPPTR